MFPYHLIYSDRFMVWGWTACHYSDVIFFLLLLVFFNDPRVITNLISEKKCLMFNLVI